jgi:hypothetical protein
MSDYANAINAAIEEQREQLRDYGRLMAQAGLPLSQLEPMPFADYQLVHEGHRQQLIDYPNG